MQRARLVWSLVPDDRRRSPHGTSAEVEQEIVEFRKHLLDEGLDAGAHTISFHLIRRHGTSPSVATIWRLLSRQGFVTPQPQKRPRSSFVRFEADQPNERWQADITHWKLRGGMEVEILNVVDDHSRFLVASQALGVFKAADVVATFHTAAAAWGFPASLLTDNAAVFPAVPRRGRCAIEVETARLGIRYVHSSPYHPQTCGKVERFHQTLKKWLHRQPKGRAIAELQGSRVWGLSLPRCLVLAGRRDARPGGGARTLLDRRFEVLHEPPVRLLGLGPDFPLQPVLGWRGEDPDRAPVADIPRGTISLAA